MTPTDGPTRRASDYGHQAFPMLVRGALQRDEHKPSGFALNAEPLPPIMSERRLKCGFAAGDFVRHDLYGIGLILSRIAERANAKCPSESLVGKEELSTLVLATDARRTSWRRYVSNKNAHN